MIMLTLIISLTHTLLYSKDNCNNNNTKTKL